MITLTVPGIPVPQGSKTPFGIEANPHLKGWRQSIAEQATTVMREREIIWDPVEVQVKFIFPRPKRHYRTGKLEGELRADAPLYHTAKPDLDKLQRAIGDALTNIVIRDDSQIARWTVSKTYGTPRAEIRVMLLPRTLENV